jgi:hypothetical protein
MINFAVARRCLLAVGALSWLSACGADSGAAGEAQEETAQLSAERATTALVDISLKSRVAVVLDEIPKAQRTAAASLYLRKPKAFWVARAKHQVRHTNYRLVYRDFFYDASEGKRTLPLPPESVWNVALDSGGARRLTTSDGHDAVEIGYVLRATIVTDPASPGEAEPALRTVGGVWKEPFNLPLDPEFLLQRTGLACMDEDGYPFGTARSENAYQLFDQDCAVETEEEAACHLSGLPNESCLDALANHVGRVDTFVRFERVPFDKKKVNAAKVGTFTEQGAPDLAVLSDELNTNWVEYRYIPEDSCSIVEECVGGPGWRRLLLFNASIRNSGAKPLVAGSTDPASPELAHNLFEFSACHEHHHFRHYGNFTYGELPGDKRAFCVESTDRYFNNSGTPLVHDFSCENQGVAPGWGDTYIAGVECNWIDVTDLSIPSSGTTQNLRFELNPDNFLCEGDRVLDDNGEPVFEPTEFVTETQQPVDRPVCDFTPNYSINNLGVEPVRLPRRGSIVTAPCSRDQAGPLRDCGFREQSSKLNCTPGETVQLRCSVGGRKAKQVLRICESSAKLGGIACPFSERLANVIADEDGVDTTFTCPTERSDDEPGGHYSMYTAPVLPMDAPARVTCELR